MNKEWKIICLYKYVKKYDPTSVILIEQGEEGQSIAMFEDPSVKPLIESAGHIYDSRVYPVTFKWNAYFLPHFFYFLFPLRLAFKKVRVIMI